MEGPSRLVSVALWLWVGTAAAAYLYQFLDLIGPIARVLGLA